MYVTIVTLRIAEEHVEQFLEAARRNHEASIREPGNRRFDVLRADDDPSCFVLYEAYSSAEAAAAHRQTAHFRAWRDTVTPWFAAPRQAQTFQALYPAGGSGRS